MPHPYKILCASVTPWFIFILIILDQWFILAASKSLLLKLSAFSAGSAVNSSSYNGCHTIASAIAASASSAPTAAKITLTSWTLCCMIR